MLTSDRLVLFIDAQNTYRGARESFFSRSGSTGRGQFDPVKLGELIASRGGPEKSARFLTQVRVYSGRPDPEIAPETYTAHMRQCAEWQANGAQVFTRPLRYPPSWPRQRAEEKGIDVALAVDFVTLAVDAAYDVGVVMSTDTDILPALEFTHRRYPNLRHVEVAAWRSPGNNRRLSLSGSNIWCHWLSRVDYDAVADTTNYNRP